MEFSFTINMIYLSEDMIKLLIKHKVLEVSINTLFDGLISKFTRRGIIRVSMSELTPDMVGKQVVFVEAVKGYDYILPSALEKSGIDETVNYFGSHMRYTIKGKRRWRLAPKCTPNSPCHYHNPKRPRIYDSNLTDEFTWGSMIFHIDMNS